jgi:hypothetical protein
MSSASRASLVGLTVTAGDEGTELFVVDGDMRLRGRGRAVLDVTLPPGVYSVRAAAGGETAEQMVVLRPGGPQQLSFPQLRFASPAPLEETATCHEYHAEFAEQESRTICAKPGAGSWVFLMARMWRPSDRPVADRSNPAAGVILRTLDGQEVFDFSRARFEDYANFPDKDPCAGGTVAVNPGLYLLERPSAGGQRLTQTISAVPAWQTQVFLLHPAPDVKGSPALDRTTVFLSDRRDWQAPCPSFHRTSLDRRLSELARLGLVGERQVLSDRVVQEVVKGKFRDPFLGLFGAHLLLLKATTPPERMALARQLEVILTTLRNLFGPGQPDVEALALALGGAQASGVFPFPPVLRRSWALIVDATVTRPDLVPRGSLASAVADRLLADEPWLVWMEPSFVTKGPVATEAVPVVPRQQNPFDDPLGRQLLAAPRATPLPKGGSPGVASGRELHRLVRTLGLPRARVEEEVKAHVESLLDWVAKQARLMELGDHFHGLNQLVKVVGLNLQSPQANHLTEPDSVEEHLFDEVTHELIQELDRLLHDAEKGRLPEAIFRTLNPLRPIRDDLNAGLQKKDYTRLRSVLEDLKVVVGDSASQVNQEMVERTHSLSLDGLVRSLEWARDNLMTASPSTEDAVQKLQTFSEGLASLRRLDQSAVEMRQNIAELLKLEERLRLFDGDGHGNLRNLEAVWGDIQVSVARMALSTRPNWMSTLREGAERVSRELAAGLAGSQELPKNWSSLRRFRSEVFIALRRIHGDLLEWYNQVAQLIESFGKVIEFLLPPAGQGSSVYETARPVATRN